MGGVTDPVFGLRSLLPTFTGQSRELDCRIACADTNVKYLQTGLYSNGSTDLIQDALVSVEWEALVVLAGTIMVSCPVIRVRTRACRWPYGFLEQCVREAAAMMAPCLRSGLALRVCVVPAVVS